MISPGSAAIISLLLPGLGQMCQGKVVRGIIWLVFTLIGYVLFVVPGLILHIVCVVNAATCKAR